jgi:hypothetical protein
MVRFCSLAQQELDYWLHADRGTEPAGALCATVICIPAPDPATHGTARPGPVTVSLSFFFFTHHISCSQKIDAADVQVKMA